MSRMPNKDYPSDVSQRDLWYGLREFVRLNFVSEIELNALGADPTISAAHTNLARAIRRFGENLHKGNSDAFSIYAIRNLKSIYKGAGDGTIASSKALQMIDELCAKVRTYLEIDVNENTVRSLKDPILNRVGLNQPGTIAFGAAVKLLGRSESSLRKFSSQQMGPKAQSGDESKPWDIAADFHNRGAYILNRFLECRISANVYHLISSKVYQSISSNVYHPISRVCVPANA